MLEIIIIIDPSLDMQEKNHFFNGHNAKRLNKVLNPHV